ncbi:MAG: hypothetical protein HY918_02155 [Candidatus Doudnabacteria bacterium]|nr:hypothetical protein [Candidatus Doudnabacteria bacterium]
MIKNYREFYKDLETIAAIVANQAYVEVARDYQEDLQDPRAEAVYMEGDKCQQVSERAYQQFKKHGVPVEYVDVDPGKIIGGNQARHHVYLFVDGNYLFDGTWQSFLEKYKKDMPYIFVSIKNLEQELDRIGVPKQVQGVWLNYQKGIKTRKAA